MNRGLKEALDMLVKEKNIDRKVMLEEIRNSLESACRNYFNRNYEKVPVDLKVVIDDDTCDYNIFLGKEVIPDDEEIISELTEVHFSEARKYDSNCEMGDIVYIVVPNIDFGHIITQNAKGVIIQKLREQEKNSLYYEYKALEHTVVRGQVGRRTKEGYNINLKKVDGFLPNRNKIKQEKFDQGDDIEVYIEEVVDTVKGPKIQLSRSCPEFVKQLFAQNVQEVRDGIVEIKSIAREAGSRTKMSVYSNDPNVDPVGSCVGVNSIRINSIIDTLNGEKIDIINWDSDISNYIENALSPAKTVAIVADEDTEAALVIVPDSQLSLAIGKEGQNARLAAKLTQYKIDIKSETQAVEAGIYDELGFEYDRSLYNNVEPEKTEKEKEEEELLENY